MLRENLNFVLQGGLGLLVAACAYFLNRLINANDEQHKNTNSALGKISGEVSELGKELGELSRKLDRTNYENQAFRVEVGKKLEDHSGLRKETQAEISKMLGIFQEVKETHETIVPEIEKVVSKVSFIEREQEDSKHKLKTLYKITRQILKPEVPE